LTVIKNGTGEGAYPKGGLLSLKTRYRRPEKVLMEKLHKGKEKGRAPNIKACSMP